MYDYKRLIGELLGAIIAVVWIFYALLWPGSMVCLVVDISLTILLGVVSGELFALSKNKSNWKRALGELLGAAIAVVWIIYAILWPGDMMFLVVAISLTILLGVLAGGFIKLSTTTKES